MLDDVIGYRINFVVVRPDSKIVTVHFGPLFVYSGIVAMNGPVDTLFTCDTDHVNNTHTIYVLFQMDVTHVTHVTCVT